MRPDLVFDHLASLTTPLGLYEHALGTTPRVEHAYCVDDAARGLVVTARVLEPDTEVRGLFDGYLAFVLAAIRPDGLLHNRRRTDGRWSDVPSSGDHWGRALWGLGTAATSGGDASQIARARAGAAVAMRGRSRWLRAMAYAALGAALVVQVEPTDALARSLLADFARSLSRPGRDPGWPWPQERLTYANAVLPEAMIAAGSALGDNMLLDDGLLLLTWLVREQQSATCLSLVPAAGRSRGDRRPAFAQQPIEVAALAEACRAAYVATGDASWAKVVDHCADWFVGVNDLGVPMCDPATGGGFDGLERHGASTNQGAESTLAWLSTLQLAAMQRQVAVG